MINQKMKMISLEKNKDLLIFCGISLSLLALLTVLYRNYFYFEKHYEFGSFELTEYWGRTLVTHSSTGINDTKLCSKTSKQCWSGLRVLSRDTVITLASKILKEDTIKIKATYFLNLKKGIILECRDCSHYGGFDNEGAYFFSDFSLERVSFFGGDEYFAGYVSDIESSRRKLILIKVSDTHMTVKELYENGLDISQNRKKVKFDIVSPDYKSFLWFSCREHCSLITYQMELDSYAVEPTSCKNDKFLRLYWVEVNKPLIRQSRSKSNNDVCLDKNGQLAPPFDTKSEYEQHVKLRKKYRKAERNIKN